MVRASPAQGDLEQTPGPPAQASREQKQHTGENIKLSREKKKQHTFIPPQLNWAGLAARAASFRLFASTRAMVVHSTDTQDSTFFILHLFVKF